MLKKQKNKKRFKTAPFLRHWSPLKLYICAGISWRTSKDRGEGWKLFTGEVARWQKGCDIVTQGVLIRFSANPVRHFVGPRRDAWEKFQSPLRCCVSRWRRDCGNEFRSLSTSQIFLILLEWPILVVKHTSVYLSFRIYKLKNTFINTGILINDLNLLPFLKFSLSNSIMRMNKSHVNCSIVSIWIL